MIAHIDRLRAELAEHKGCATARVALYEAIRELDKAEAAIARVREVCMQDSWDIKLAGVGFVDVRLVLRALDGVE